MGDLIEKVQPKPEGFIGPGRMEKVKPRYCDMCGSEMLFQDDHWVCQSEDCSDWATRMFKAKGSFSTILGGWVLNAPKGYVFQLSNGHRITQIHLRSIRHIRKDLKHTNWVESQKKLDAKKREAHKPCPKCRGEMEICEAAWSGPYRKERAFWRCKCGYEERVK